MKQLKRILLLCVLVMIVGVGASLTLKVAIGVGAWDALASSLSFLSGIKVGTIGMIMNISCVLGQWILLKKDFKIKHLLQVPMSILIGFVVNFMLYDVLATVTIDSYFIKLLLFCVALFVVALGLAAVLLLDVVTFPLEGFCLALAQKTNWKFVIVRQSADVISCLLAVLLTFSLALPLTLREGTVIGMLLFAPVVGVLMKAFKPILKKYDLLYEKEENIVTDYESVKNINNII